MKKILTTTSGTPISRFCFGTMQFGGKANRAASSAMFDACLSAGINFFDTAHVYNKGRSEKLLGKFAKGKTDDLFIATKCASTGGGSRNNILSQFDKSRKRLGMDSVDLLYLHQWTSDVALEQTFETLASLKSQRKIRFVGVSNYAAWQVMKANSVAREFGFDIAMLQPMYNLVKRQAEVEILPMALSEGLAVCPYSPLGGGLLTGKYASGETGRLSTDKMYINRYGQTWMHDTAVALVKLSHEVGVPAATLAVAWVARNPAIAAPIISARTPEQLQFSLGAIGLTLEEEIYRRISALSPSPPPATDRSEEQ